jgi:AcrR family transcriptional regulator
VVETRAQTCRPLRRDAERNRQRILEAARQLFAQQGMAVSHDQLAEAADVAVGTVYRRFPDKDSLLEALFTEDIDRVVKLARSALEVPDPWDGLVKFVTESLELQAGNRGFKEFLMYNVTSDTMTDCRARLLPVIDEIVARAHAAGLLRPGVTTVDLGMVPVMLGPVMDGCRELSPDLWRRSLHIVLDGLRVCATLEELPALDVSPDEVFEIIRCSHIAPGRR